MLSSSTVDSLPPDALLPWLSATANLAGPAPPPPGPGAVSRRRPPECPVQLWHIILQECGEECLQGLLPHIGVVAALSVELAAIGDGRLRGLLRELNEVYCRLAVAETTCHNLEQRCRHAEISSLAQKRACESQVTANEKKVTEQIQTAAQASMELQQARQQVEALTSHLEEANRRVVDASAYWDQQLRAERERCVASSIALQDQVLAMQRALDAERFSSQQALTMSRDMAARLDATTDEFFKTGHELAFSEQRASEVQRSAECEIAQMHEMFKRTLKLWQQGREEEVGELRRRLELLKLGGVGGVSAEEADRSLLLVAALWHAAGRQEPHEMTQEQRERSVGEALNAWRVYFHREVSAEAPLLRPTSSIILGPLRAAAGQRASEVLARQPRPYDPSRLAPPKRSVEPAPSPL